MKRRKVILALVTPLLIIVALYACTGSEGAQAQTNGPYEPSGILVTELGNEVPAGRLNVRFPTRDPQQIDAEIRDMLQRSDSYNARLISTQTVPTITVEIQALVDGLENDPFAIYDHVHNYIDYVPSWGLLKNPRETLLSGIGNAFDQSSLLSALLEAAGFQTRYVWGTVQLDKTVAMNWVGASDPDAVGFVFASGGIPTAVGADIIQISHVWVEVFDGGTWHSLDPSFKTYVERSGQDLRSIIGSSDLSSFIARAESGATITADSVQDLNQTNIYTDLLSYTLNLIEYLRDGDTFVYTEDLIGDRQIKPTETTVYPSSLPYTVVTISGTANDVPNSLSYTLTIQLPGLNYVTNIDDIAGERITIFYECATPADCQTLEDEGGIYNIYPAYQVNVVPRLRIGGTVVATGSISVPLGTWGQPLTATIGTPSVGSFTTYQSLVAGEWYALAMRLQNVSSGALARHTELLDEAIAQGLGPDDERVLGQILYLLGLSYFNEVDLGDRIDTRIAEVVHVPHFSLMIAARNLTIWVDVLQRPVMLDPASHTVDVRLSMDSAISAQNPADSDRERAWFLSAGMRGSAVEHAIIEQLRFVPAVSTIQALNLAIEEGQPIYYITPTNWSAVYPQLGHPIYVLNALVADLNQGRHIVIHQDPITYYQWEGSGWISLDPNSGSAGYMISGGLGSTGSPKLLTISGGGGAVSEPELGTEPGRQEDTSNTRLVGSWTTQNRGLGLKPHTEGFTEDPINAATGSFVYRHLDLASLGGLGIPLGLERLYDSSRHNISGTLGYGWSHTYNMRFYTHTNWIRGFGSRMALEAAPALVASQVCIDLFDLPNIPHPRFSMGATVAWWLMAQITDNAVTLLEPDGNVATHLGLVDGTYQPPPGGSNLYAVTTASGSATLDWEDGTHIHFNADGRPIALEDANGNQTTLVYDSQDQLVQVTDAVARSLMFTYNARGLLSQITDPAGRTLGYTYDEQGNLWTHTDTRGGTITYTYDADHHLTEITNQIGTTYVINQYDALGRVTNQENGRGGHTSLRYGDDYTVVTDPLGHQTTFAFDERNRLASIENALGDHSSIGYNAADHQISRTNGLSETVVLGYDPWGHLTTITDSLGHTLSWTYDDVGNPTSHTDRQGKRWQFGYDGRHNLVTVTHPLSGTTVYTYTDQGQVIQVQDPAGVSVAYGYDVHGNLTCTTNALSEASCWSYDAIGRPISYTDGLGHTYQFSYDAADNLLQVTDPLDHPTGYLYDAAGSLVQITNTNGYTTSFAYDAHFNLTGVTDALGQATAYAYDANDGLALVTDTLAHATTYQRDPVGRVITITDPLNRSVIFGYDAANRIARFTRADGSAIDYQRDGIGRLIGIDYPTGPDVAYGHDAAGNLISATYGSAWSTGYVYDAAGRLTMMVDSSRSLTTTFAYDLAGRRTGLRVTRGPDRLYDLTYGYDAAGRVVTLTDQTSIQTATVSLGYDAAGRMIQITDPGGSRADYVYDAAGRLAAIGHRDGRGDNVATYTYGRDASGNPTVVTETLPVGDFVTRYAYDPLNRLTAEVYPRYAISYTYDSTGNLVHRVDALETTIYTYDDAGQLQSRGDEQFGYDDHGNVTTWQNARGTYTYTYDYDNRITDLAMPGGTVLTFTYDAFGRRLTVQGPDGTRGFLHDGLGTLLEGNGDLSQTKNRYIYGNGLLVARYTDQLGFTAYHGDSGANVRYLLDEASRPFDAYHYDGFGRAAYPAGIDPTAFRFAGQYGVYQHDVPDWPALLMGLRYYQPGDGHFLTRDPWPGDLLHPQTLNDYNYAWSNPLRYSDPTGLTPLSGIGKVQPQSADPASTTSEDRGAVLHNLAGLPAGVSSSRERQRNPSIEQSSSPVKRWETPPRQRGGEASTPSANPTVAPAGDMAGPLPGAHVPSPPPTGRSKPRGTSTSPALWSGGSFGGQGMPLSLWGLPRQPCSNLACWFHLWYGLYPSEWFDYFTSGPLYSAGMNALQAGPARWAPTYSYGSTYALACTADDQLLAGAFHAGLFSSTDDGHAIWNQANTTGVSEIAIAAPDSYYAGTRYSGALKSDDGGASWTPINTGLRANDVYALAASSSTPDHLFAGTEMGLFASTDGGAAWGRPSSVPPGRLVSDLTFSGDTLLVVTDLGLYRSENNGASWLTATEGLPAVRINTLFVIPPTTTVYAGTSRGLYESTDGGGTWNVSGTGLTDRDVHALAVDPANASYMVAGTTDGLFVSTDSGENWTADTHAGLDGIASLVGALAFCPAGGDANLYLGAGGGVYALRVPTPPASVTVSGPTTGIAHTGYTFSVTVHPAATTRPITYLWEATGQNSVTHPAVGTLTDTVSFTWPTPGVKVITVTVSNTEGVTSTTHAITILVPPTAANIVGPTTGAVDESYTFTTTVTPATATLPLTYVWEATGQDAVTNDNVYSIANVVSFTWGTPGPKAITVTVSNGAGTISATHTVTISVPPHSVSITGSQTGIVGESYTFTVTVKPVTITLPITYIWQMTDQTTVTNTGVHTVTHTESFAWSAPGVKTITVTVSNSAGMTRTTHTINVSVPPSTVEIEGITVGLIDTRYDFDAQVYPVTTTLPITYIWQATDQATVTSTGVHAVIHAVPFTWNVSGPKIITVTVDNGSGMSHATHVVIINDTPQSPTQVEVVGPAAGAIHTRHHFTATVGPITTTQPITYIWEASDQDTVFHDNVNSRTDVVSFTWPAPGVKTITVTVSNSAGYTHTTHVIRLGVPPAVVHLDGPAEGTIKAGYTFTATVGPITTTRPLTYTWEATDHITVPHGDIDSLTDTISFTWEISGTKTITVTVGNSVSTASITHTIAITEESQFYIYLPLILRSAEETSGHR